MIPDTIKDVIKALIILFLSLAITYYFLDIKPDQSKLFYGLVNVVSLLAWGGIYNLIHMFVFAPAQARKAYKDLGFWDKGLGGNDTFYYNTPIHVGTYIVHPGAHSRVIKFPKELNDLFVSTTTISSGCFNRVKAGIGLPLRMDKGGGKGWARVNRSKCILATDSAPNTIPVRVDIHVDAWQL